MIMNNKSDYDNLDPLNLLKSFVRSILILFLMYVSADKIHGQKISLNVFLRETPGEYIFINQKTQLVIRKEIWNLRLIGEDGIVRFIEGKAPAFLINDKWVTLSRTERLVSRDEKRAILQVSLSNGTKASAEVESLSNFGFKIIIKPEKNEASALRGIIALNPVEEVYGFGEMWNGHVAQRGQSFDIWDKAGTPDECSYMPYFVSTNNYAFFLNYGGMVSFDVGQSNANELVYQAPAPFFDITLVSGNSIASSVQNFLTIAGMPAKPPRWAFEPWFWLMSDPDKPGESINTLRGEHFIVMLDKLKELDIPIGVTWLEPPWQDARTSFIPNTEFCPDLKGLIKRISDRGVKTLAWTVPYTTNTSSNWKEAVAKGYLVRKPESKKGDEKFTITASGELEGNFYTYIDFFNPEAARWWQEQVEKSLDLGLRGYKLDAAQDLQEDALLYGGRRGSDVHNSYALEYNRVYYNAFKNRLGDDFLMIPRATWVGSSSFTNFKWPGDLSGSFANNGLPSTVYSSLSLAFSGIPFVSTDIGGFSDKPAPENAWIRWAQFGAFLPGMQTLHMPWWYSGEATAHFRYLAWLHNDLIPLWMSLASEAHQNGSPVIRPLVWSFQDDIKCWRVDDEFTVGQSILVAPIINPETNRSVYLPAGIWYDFWDDNQTYKGPLRFNWSKSGSQGRYRFPVFIKGGSIIPMEISNNVTGFGSSASKGYLTIAVWPEKNKSSEFLLNDREESVLFNSDWEKEDMISVSWGKTVRNYIFRIHSTNKPLKVVARSGKILRLYDDFISFNSDKGDGWFYESTKKKLWIRLNNSNQPESISVFLQ
jgi:alpha-D-xyloside xylohydrolase